MCRSYMLQIWGLKNHCLLYSPPCPEQPQWPQAGPLPPGMGRGETTSSVHSGPSCWWDFNPGRSDPSPIPPPPRYSSSVLLKVLKATDPLNVSTNENQAASTLGRNPTQTGSQGKATGRPKGEAQSTPTKTTEAPTAHLPLCSGERREARGKRRGTSSLLMTSPRFACFWHSQGPGILPGVSGGTTLTLPAAQFPSPPSCQASLEPVWAGDTQRNPSVPLMRRYHCLQTRAAVLCS